MFLLCFNDYCYIYFLQCHHLLEEHEELVEQFWFKEYAKQKDTDFFQWFCVDNIKGMADVLHGVFTYH